MKSNRVTKERHKALIEDYVAQLEQADTDKVRATSGSDAVTTLSLDAVRLPPPATPGAGALGDDVYNAAGPMTEDMEMLLREQATLEAVSQRMPSVDLLHFACHASGDRLVMAGGEQLHMAQIYEMRLRARVVVLSGCSTGRGQIQSEGILGVSRAFLAAGAESVVVALWNLFDASANHVMQSFYRELLAGRSCPHP